jgi:hemerythrin
MVEDLSAVADPTNDLSDARRVLYSLDAVLRLHFAQEEELYQTLDDSYHDQTTAGTG